MKTNFFRLFSATAIIAGAALFYTGCKKEEDKKPTDYSASTDNANANNAFAGIWKQISLVTDSSNALRSTAASCGTASITPFDLVTWPKTVLIDFGTVNHQQRTQRGRTLSVQRAREQR